MLGLSIIGEVKFPQAITPNAIITSEIKGPVLITNQTNLDIWISWFQPHQAYILTPTFQPDISTRADTSTRVIRQGRVYNYNALIE